MAHPFDWRALDGRTLASVFSEFGTPPAGNSDWSVMPLPNGGVRFFRPGDDYDIFFMDDPPRSSPPPVTVNEELIARLRALVDGELRIEVDGDYTTGHSTLVLPVGFWRNGHWRFDWENDFDRARLQAVDDIGRKVGPVYFNPRFAAPAAGQEQPDATSARRRNKKKETEDQIARGVELCRANGGNYSSAARALYAELHPRPSDPKRQVAYDDEERRFVRRVKDRISEKMRRRSQAD